MKNTRMAGKTRAVYNAGFGELADSVYLAIGTRTDPPHVSGIYPRLESVPPHVMRDPCVALANPLAAGYLFDFQEGDADRLLFRRE